MELLVRRLQKPNWSAQANGTGSWIGDVVTIHEDGWPWSQRELTNPEWLVVKVPGVPASQGAILLASAFDAKNVMLWKRAKGFDTTDVAWNNLVKLRSPVTVSQAQWNNFVNKVITKSTQQVTVG